MFTVKDYCKCCKDDAYGGSIELVNAGIDALLNDIEAGEIKTLQNSAMHWKHMLMTYCLFPHLYCRL